MDAEEAHEEDQSINAITTDKLHKVIQTQIDTGTDATDTNRKDLLHDYRPYTEKYKCPVCLCSAMDQNAFPKGEGFMHITSLMGDVEVAIEVKTYYSEAVMSTLVNPSDMMTHTLDGKYGAAAMNIDYYRKK